MSLLGLLSLSLLTGPAAPSAPQLVTLVTPAWSGTSELRRGDHTLARFDHLPGAAVRGAQLPHTDLAVAIADTSPRRDLSYAASLFLLTPDHPPRRLCDDVVHASRPLVAPDGRIYVIRGAAGPDTTDATPRLDSLTLDEIDPATGVPRTLHHHTGQFLHLAGWHADTVILYRIDAATADLVAVDTTPPFTVHPLADIPPYARDFSVDRDTLTFHDRDDIDPHTWHLEQLDLLTATTRTLAADIDPRAQPFAAAGTVFAALTGDMLHRLDGRPLAAPCKAAPCIDVIRHATPDGRWLAGLHVRPGALPRPFTLDAATGQTTLADAPSAWVDLLGFAAGGAR